MLCKHIHPLNHCVMKRKSRKIAAHKHTKWHVGPLQQVTRLFLFFFFFTFNSCTLQNGAVANSKLSLTNSEAPGALKSNLSFSGFSTLPTLPLFLQVISSPKPRDGSRIIQSRKPTHCILKKHRGWCKKSLPNCS